MADLIARNRILALQDAMLALPEEHKKACMDACVVTHHFAPGMYIREMLIPEGTVIVGKLHRHAHANTISLGMLEVATEFDKYQIHAPYTFVSEPGTKRVVVALTDVIWTTYHLNPTDTRDLAVLEREIIASDYKELT